MLGKALVESLTIWTEHRRAHFPVLELAVVVPVTNLRNGVFANWGLRVPRWNCNNDLLV
jgi:hypothetical protein